MLRIEAGATLLGSTNLADYPAQRPAVRSYADNYGDQSLLYGEDLEHIGLVGDGVIDGHSIANCIVTSPLGPTNVVGPRRRAFVVGVRRPRFLTLDSHSPYFPPRHFSVAAHHGFQSTR
jgi:hypothetical protein